MDKSKNNHLRREPRAAPTAQKLYKVLHNYSSTDPGALTLSRNETVQVVDEDADLDGWVWVRRLASGAEGSVCALIQVLDRRVIIIV